MTMRTPGDRVPGAQWSRPLPGAQWFAGHDAVGQPGLVAQDYPPTLGIKADELHQELHRANMRYDLLRGFVFWVGQQRGTEGMTVAAICDAADRALQGDKLIEVSDEAHDDPGADR
jgi:hypothetical protein